MRKDIAFIPVSLFTCVHIIVNHCRTANSTSKVAQPGCAKLCRRHRQCRRPSYWGMEKLKEGKQAYALIRQREPQQLKKYKLLI